MTDVTAKLNTLNSLLPQQVPFVIGQIGQAVQAVEETEEFERNLDTAIHIAEVINKYTQGDLLYNYVPILLSLLKDVPETVNLAGFDTIGHDIPVGIAIVKQFVNNYSKNVKNAAGDIINLKSAGNDNVCMVILANFLADLRDGKNVLAIAYIMTNLNMAHVQFVNEAYELYCEILTGINNQDF